MSSLKPELDPALDAIVLDCLEKDPKERCQSIAEVARDLRKVKRESTRQRHSRVTAARPSYRQSGIAPAEEGFVEERHAAPEAGQPRGIWKWTAVAFLLTTLAAVAGIWFGNKPQPAQTIRSFIPMPPNTFLSNDIGGGHLALSPSGERIAFVAVDTTGTPNLWVRSLDALSAQVLSGTEGAVFPFWSPDGRTIAFFANSKLRKIDASGGTPFTICDAEAPRSGSWSASGVIVFSPRSGNDGLFKVAAAGGEPVQITRIDTARKEETHRWPWFLPDGDHFIFFSRTSAAGSGSNADSLCIGSVSTGEVRRIARGISDAAYAGGRLLYMRESALMAQPFDYEKAVFTGEPVPVAQEIQYDSRFSKAVFTVSSNGLLLYQTGASRWGREVALFDTSGAMVKSLGRPELFSRADISSDGKRIAMEIIDLQAHNTDLWIYEIARGIQTRFTFDPHADFAPHWSPDDRSIVFSSDRKNHFDLYIKNTSGSASDELLTDFGAADKYATDWSPDGKYILFQMTGDSTLQSDIWVLPMTGERKPVPFVRTPFNEIGARFSPDMRWVAYTSEESGSPQVYVRPFVAPDAPGGGTASGKWQVSTEPARGARWRADGKAIIFGTVSNRSMIADVRANGSDFEILGVRPYSRIRSKYPVSVIDLTPDGLTFLGWIPPSGAKTVPLTLVTNWDTEIGKP
jgi:Tol biopolymer transport system component